MKLKITLQGGATIEIDGVEKFETEQSAPSFPLQPNNPFPPILPYPPIVYPGTGGTGDYQRPFDVT